MIFYMNVFLIKYGLWTAKVTYEMFVFLCRHWTLMRCLLEMFLLKSVHFKETVAQSSFLSKLWYSSIQHQLTSKQSQLMLHWKVPQFWKKWGSCNCVLKWTEFRWVFFESICHAIFRSYKSAFFQFFVGLLCDFILFLF